MKAKIRIVKNGPYLVTGGVPLHEKIIEPEGRHYVYRNGRDLPQAETYALCRCGKTKKAPFCDGSHALAGFDGAETASRAPFDDRARTFRGPDLDMKDDGRCALARFCHRESGDAWELVGRSGDPHNRAEAVIAAAECPAGRLVAVAKDGQVIEPDCAPGIEILQDPEEGVSAAIFVRGNIPIESSDGTTYEIRNRVTLCRCGASENKPFCDAAHIGAEYSDSM